MSEEKDKLTELRERIAAAKSKPIKAGKRPVGRPSSYEPEFCDIIIELGKLGFSHAELAAELDVDKASLYDWAAAHKDFSTALRAAKTHEQAWFEREARDNMKNRDFNANLWYRSAASRFREDYTERKSTEISGPEGAPIQVQHKEEFDPRNLEPDQREALKQLILAAKGKAS